MNLFFSIHVILELKLKHIAIFDHSKYELMKKIFATLLFSFVLVFSHAHEGMWIPSLIKMYYPQMKKDGLKLSAEQIYNINSSSMKDAVIHFNGGCTSEIVSEKGYYF